MYSSTLVQPTYQRNSINIFINKLHFCFRFHICKGDTDAHLAIHKMINEGLLDENDPNFPAFQGDDLQALLSEIKAARKYVSQSRLYKQVVSQHREELAANRPATVNVSTDKFVSDKPFLPY